MIDRREGIIARLVELMDSVDGVEVVYRNNPNPNEGKMPAIVVFDADEEQSPVPENMRNKGATAPVFLTMKPEIFIVLSDRAANAGSRLNELRARVLKAIANDQTLVDLATTNGRINLHSTRTGFAVGRSLAAEMKIEIGFTYPLLFSDLADA